MIVEYGSVLASIFCAVVVLTALGRMRQLSAALRQAEAALNHCRSQLHQLRLEVDSLRRSHRDLIIMVATLSHGINDDAYRRRLRRSLERQREELLRSLRHLEERISHYTPAEVPVFLTTERERLQEAIHELEAQLDYLNGEPP
ncbi:MAG: hypothetical protein RMN24_00725 [Anaerolineae bacterium]|nr:hypothetical protein [Caldilineales bacterium]MDW8267663.1 hypothetical protein [Anaerolineae bacterium]